MRTHTSQDGVLKNNFPQQKWISKNRQQEVEHMAESEIFPNWHVFVSIFGQ